MSKENCTNCGWATWQLHPSGRRYLDQGGVCMFEATIPLSYADMYGDLPHKRDVSKYTHKKSAGVFLECECWKPIRQKRNKENAVEQPATNAGQNR